MQKETVVVVVEIYYNDLTPEKQSEILEAAGLSNPADGNYDTIPLAIVGFDSNNDDITDPAV